MEQAGLPRKQALRWSLAFRILRNALGINTCGREEKEAGAGRGRNQSVIWPKDIFAQSHWGALEQKGPFKIVSNWSKTAKPLHFHISQVWAVGHKQERARPWERQLSAS